MCSFDAAKIYMAIAPWVRVCNEFTNNYTILRYPYYGAVNQLSFLALTSALSRPSAPAPIRPCS
ncbi:hypothetical protein BC936DRAFT_141159 [Jimgerdemannia flammicorona]|uniref:Uncharacterized protein n=1 Tax=Jimgerdemannia flammicorona TaxID=994334 RepID=A0A433A2S9_9FUNG|nr:hypothetical protein BC936DRAFT_141159 [Jimgerdemannia flammicorona]